MSRSRLFIAVAALAALYVVSPVDAIPDVVPGVGWVDDSLVAAATFLLGALGKRHARKTAAKRAG
jgi:uncharacterized membrane protein YkvA (DUF1232 family)